MTQGCRRQLPQTELVAIYTSDMTNKFRNHSITQPTGIGVGFGCLGRKFIGGKLFRFSTVPVRNE